MGYFDEAPESVGKRGETVVSERLKGFVAFAKMNLHGHHGRRHRTAENGAVQRLEKFDDYGGGGGREEVCGEMIFGKVAQESYF